MGSSTSFRLAWTTRSAMVGIPSFRNFPVFPFGIITCRTSTGRNSPDFSESRIWPRKASTPTQRLDPGRRGLVDPCGLGALVSGHAFPRVHQERRVVDEVEQVTETAGRIFSRPAVQLGLHPPYHDAGREIIRPRHGAGIHRRIFGHYIPSLTDTLPPFPMCTGFPRLGVLRRLRPARAFGRRRAYPRPAPWPGDGHGNVRGRFPRSLLSGRRVRHPALPLRHRHGYAADNSPWPPGPGNGDPARSSPPVMKGRCAPQTSPHPPG